MKLVLNVLNKSLIQFVILLQLPNIIYYQLAFCEKINWYDSESNFIFAEGSAKIFPYIDLFVTCVA